MRTWKKIDLTKKISKKKNRPTKGQIDYLMSLANPAERTAKEPALLLDGYHVDTLMDEFKRDFDLLTQASLAIGWEVIRPAGMTLYFATTITVGKKK